MKDLTKPTCVKKLCNMCSERQISRNLWWKAWMISLIYTQKCMFDTITLKYSSIYPLNQPPKTVLYHGWCKVTMLYWHQSTVGYMDKPHTNFNICVSGNSLSNQNVVFSTNSFSVLTSIYNRSQNDFAKAILQLMWVGKKKAQLVFFHPPNFSKSSAPLVILCLIVKEVTTVVRC